MKRHFIFFILLLFFQLSACMFYYPPTDISHNISYKNLNGANNSLNPSTFTELENVTLTDATKVGYTFDGWFDASTGGTQVTGWLAGEKTSDVEVWAKWTAE